MKGLSKIAKHTTRLLLTGSIELEGLSTLDGQEASGLALGALKLKNGLPGELTTLAENRLGLTTKTGLLHVVTTTTLGGVRLSTLVVRGDTVGSVLRALTTAVSVAVLGDVHHLVPYTMGHSEIFVHLSTSHKTETVSSQQLVVLDNVLNLLILTWLDLIKCVQYLELHNKSKLNCSHHLTIPLNV